MQFFCITVNPFKDKIRARRVFSCATAASTEVSRGRVCCRCGTLARGERKRGSPDEEVVGAVQMFSKVDRERDQLVRERPHKQDATSRTTHQQPQQPLTSLKQAEQLINNHNNNHRQVSNNPRDKN